MSTQDGRLLMTEYASICLAQRNGPVFALTPEGPQSAVQDWHELEMLPIPPSAVISLFCKWCGRMETVADWTAIQSNRLTDLEQHRKSLADAARGRPLTPSIVVPRGPLSNGKPF